MEFKGTKGEWKITGTEEQRTMINGSSIDVWWNLTSSDVLEDEGKANAKLIAAAPDLLKACIHALEMCEDRVTPTENDLTVMAGRLKEAINKALN
jgi:hypothetical protein